MGNRFASCCDFLMRHTYIVSYDIADPKRLRCVADILEGTGGRAQKSVFECFLSGAELRQLQQWLRVEIDSGQDSVRYYPLCRWCLNRLEWQGKGVAPVRSEYYVV